MNLKLKEMRKKQGLLQGELAQALNVRQATVSSWERGDTQMNAEQLWKCCTILECTPNDLLGWYDEHPEDRPQYEKLKPDEQDLLCYYGETTISNRAIVISVARAMRDSSRSEEVGVFESHRPSG